MRFSPHILIVFLALTPRSATSEVGAGGTGNNTDPKPEQSGASSESLDLEKWRTDPFWSRLLAQLGKSTTRYSTFVEERHFPFRRTPVRLSGEIRIAPKRGMSLRYLEPQERILIVDEEGILMKNHQKRRRTSLNSSRASGVSRALTQIIRFEIQELASKFDIWGSHCGENWSINLNPIYPELAKQVGIINVEGTDMRLNNIEMLRSRKTKIRITIDDAVEDELFTSDEMERFFR